MKKSQSHKKILGRIWDEVVDTLEVQTQKKNEDVPVSKEKF